MPVRNKGPENRASLLPPNKFDQKRSSSRVKAPQRQVLKYTDLILL